MMLMTCSSVTSIVVLMLAAIGIHLVRPNLEVIRVLYVLVQRLVDINGHIVSMLSALKLLERLDLVAHADQYERACSFLVHQQLVVVEEAEGWWLSLETSWCAVLDCVWDLCLEDELAVGDVVDLE